MVDDRNPGEGRPAEPGFDPKILDRAVIALPLLQRMAEAEKSDDPTQPIHVILEANLLYPEGREGALRVIETLVREVSGDRPDALEEFKNKYSRQYVFAALTPEEIRALARKMLADPKAKAKVANDADPPSPGRAIFRIWLDHEIRALTNKSISTVKADAAANAFGAFGNDIVWAVMDSGIDGRHEHFVTHDTLDLKPPLKHRDFTGSGGDALRDAFGHGTHVAGIIAGEYRRKAPGDIIARVKRFTEDGNQEEVLDDTAEAMRGMAPRAKLLSIKVLDDRGGGRASNLIAALQYIQELNANGRNILVHGVNLSVGYGFEPNWFACGQSPLCVEVNRLVRSGVVVVVAAGNTGYGYNQIVGSGPKSAGLDITINDPGNAELAITVGSTHRDMPHVYGVSFFSSKGPTGDGRLKPDLVAPGEKIRSCQSLDKPPPANASGQAKAFYVEDSGTSMAAPHVSGVIASFLSIRREFIGEPERVKGIFLDSATDLKRAVYFQGRGLVDLMRAIQSV
ncbi:MAG TPA: S8 family serine peptidase [Allosphingosinicella sp.]